MWWWTEARQACSAHGLIYKAWCNSMVQPWCVRKSKCWLRSCVNSRDLLNHQQQDGVSGQKPAVIYSFLSNSETWILYLLTHFHRLGRIDHWQRSVYTWPTCDCLKTSLAMASRFPRSLMEDTYSETALITTSQGGSTNWWARTWERTTQVFIHIYLTGWGGHFESYWTFYFMRVDKNILLLIVQWCCRGQDWRLSSHEKAAEPNRWTESLKLQVDDSLQIWALFYWQNIAEGICVLLWK